MEGPETSQPLSSESAGAPAPFTRLALASAAAAAVAAFIAGCMYIFGGPRDETSYFSALAVGIPFFLALPFLLQMNSVFRGAPALLQTQADARADASAGWAPTSRLRASAIEGFRAVRSSLLIDEDGKRLSFVVDSQSPAPRLLSYKDLVSSEIAEDGTSVLVTRTSRSSQLGGALVGGAVFGGVGAVVGALTGSSVSTGSDFVTRIELRVVVNNPADPLITILFLGSRTARASAAYREARNAAQQWHATLTVLIKQADVEIAQPAPAPPNPSIADELRKFADLHAAGVLTDEEFISQKNRILGGK